MTENKTTRKEAQEATVSLHPFSQSGMGDAPFKFVGVCSMPNLSLAEANPEAYNMALRMLPRHLIGGIGTCGHCGMAITNMYIVRNAKGEECGVGCDCIQKVGDHKMVTAMKAAKLKLEREKRALRNEIKRAARAAEAETARKAEIARDIAHDVRIAREAYEKDIEATPLYHDGTPRKTWNQLGYICKLSWMEDRPFQPKI